MVLPFFNNKLNLIDFYKILYQHGFIQKVDGKVSNNGRRFYNVTMEKSDLEEAELPIKLFYRYLNYIHRLDPAENLRLQKVLDYKIYITDDELQNHLADWKIKKFEQYQLEQNISAEELRVKIDNHNWKVENGYKWWSRDNFSGRRHHLLSYSPSFLREFINEDLVEMDIKQCQPALLAILEERNTGWNPYSSLFYDENFDIYEYLSTNRNIGKRLFYQLFFGYGTEKNNFIIKQKFPEYAERLIDLKYNPELMGFSERDKRLKLSEDKRFLYKADKYYKSVSLATQMLEVELFEGVWKKLLKDKIFFIPIHDAVYVKRADTRIVKTVIKTEIDKQLRQSKIKIIIK